MSSGKELFLPLMVLNKNCGTPNCKTIIYRRFQLFGSIFSLEFEEGFYHRLSAFRNTSLIDAN